MLNTGLYHPDISFFYLKVAPVALAVNHVGQGFAAQYQPGLVAVMKVHLDGSLRREPYRSWFLVYGHRAPPCNGAALLWRPTPCAGCQGGEAGPRHLHADVGWRFPQPDDSWQKNRLLERHLSVDAVTEALERPVPLACSPPRAS